MKKSLKETNEFWKEGYNQKWEKSNLSSMISKPKISETQTIHEKGLALKIMSLDLNTTEKKH